jgi:hypothetical protein
MKALDVQYFGSSLCVGVVLSHIRTWTVPDSGTCRLLVLALTVCVDYLEFFVTFK